MQRYSSPEVKAKAQQMSDLMTGGACQARRRKPLLSPEAKQAAAAKLASLRILVGYPDRFDAYAGLTIDPARFLRKRLAIGGLCVEAQLGKLKRTGAPSPNGR